MASFKHDSAGFLVGELLDVNRELLAAQGAGMAVWRGIHTDVKAIARALGVQARMARAQQRDSTAGQPGSTRARDADGRFVRHTATPAGRSGNGGARSTTGTPGAQRTGASAAESAGRQTSTATVTPAGRTSRSRLPGAGGTAAPEDIGTQDALTRFTGGKGGGAGDGLGRLSGAIEKLGLSLDGADQLDPTIAAMKEVKDTVSPLGRGMFAMLGRNAERKKERWYGRILKALTGKKPDTGSGGGSGGKEDVGFFDVLIGMFGGLFATALLPVIAAIGTAIVAMAPVVGAALAVALAAWLAKKALETPAAQEAKANFDKGVAEKTDPVKYAPFGSTMEQVLDASGRDLNDSRRIDRKDAVGTDGRAINDPRRIDAAPSTELTELPPATSMAQRAGRFVGWVKRVIKNGTDVQSDADASDPVDRSKMTKKQRAAADLKQRSLETGAQYSAGNIGGLDDTQTRALVASTVMTESHGGDPRAINPSNGFMGRYQAGAGWLSDAGLIKGGNGALKKAMAKDGFTLGGPGQEDKWGQQGGMTRFLKDDANWNNGLSYEKYLGSADTQDKAFKTNSDAAYNSLMKNPAVTDKSPENMAGLLKARHIAGLGGAVRMAQGMTGAADSNGTTARKYYDDVAKDRNGFLSAYTGGATVSAGFARIPPVVIPSSVPERIAPAPDAAIPAQLNTNKPVPVNVSMREPIGQDVGDRSIAHVVSGGLGMMA